MVAPDDTVTTLVEASGGGEDSLQDYTFEPVDGVYKIKVVGAGQPNIEAWLDFLQSTWGSAG